MGRNARLYKDGVVIGYGKNISVKASAELIKEYSMDSLTPAIVAPGKQGFNWSAEKLDVVGTYTTSRALKLLFIEKSREQQHAVKHNCFLVYVMFFALFSSDK